MVSKHYDIAIIGGGLSGMSLACLLGGSGKKVICIDRDIPATSTKQDLRTTAISYGSSKILEEAGIWNGLLKTACPIRDIQILDGDSPLLLQFLSAEVGGNSFGWIVLNADMRRALLKRMTSFKNITHLAPANVKDFSRDEKKITIHLEGNDKITTSLAVGADGRSSKMREWMDIPERGWKYNQRAVIFNVAHQNPHHSAAVEHFWPSGPFAVLPMSDGPKGEHRSSIVFTEHGREEDSLVHYSEAAFQAALEARFPAAYGAVKPISKPTAYPLSLIHAGEYTAPRMALVADAAHGIHPIAGQGLNLGFRDIKALADLVRNAPDPGAPQILEAYTRARRFDNMSMVAVTDALVRLFSNDLPPIRTLRRLGLRAVSRLKPAKRFFMKRAMGGS